MKTLTIKQPWAASIIVKKKDVENRSWSTSYRGPVLIHAGLGAFRDFDAMEYISERVSSSSLDLIKTIKVTRGAIIGIAEIVDCVRDSRSKWAIDGHWHWILKNQKNIVPIYTKGKLGLWDFPY